MAESPVNSKTDLATYSILSNGTEIPDMYHVKQIIINRQVNNIAGAEITLHDGNPAESDFIISDSKTFIPGAEIEIKLGYHSENHTVYKGIVTGQTIEAGDGLGNRLKVVCEDKALKMTINRKSTVFNETSDSDIIKKILAQNSLTAKVDSTPADQSEMVQYYATDWDFIMDRAKVNGMVIITDNGTVNVVKPNVKSGPVLGLTYGHDIRSFNLSLDAADQLQGVTSYSWDPKTQKVLDAKASKPTENQQGNLSGDSLSKVLDAGTHDMIASPIDKTALNQWANSTLAHSRLSRFSGTITFQGSALAAPNSTVSLHGLGDRFNGTAYVSGVTHVLTDDSWTTEIEIGLSARLFEPISSENSSFASGLLPAVQGLQTGTVKKIIDDPDKEYRVQVQMPLLPSSNKLVWARLATFYAGTNKTGAFFFPEVGEEVILGFMNNDPRFPIILGSVYGTKNQPPTGPDKKNSIKTIITREKLQLSFDDDKKVIELKTSRGNSLTLSEHKKSIAITDQNSNEIIMDSSGISIKSPKNITLDAKQNITIKGININLDAKGNVSAKGMKATLRGDTEAIVEGSLSATLKGTALCTVSADGQVILKGKDVLKNNEPI